MDVTSSVQKKKKKAKNFLLISSLSLFKPMVEIAPNKKFNSLAFLLTVHQQEVMQPFTTQYFRVTFGALLHYQHIVFHRQSAYLV